MIKLLYYGDFVSQNPQRLVLSSDIEYLVSESDVVYCNFEAPINGVGSPLIKSGPALTQSSDSPKILEKFGFNLIGLANNHMMDMGEDACRATIKSFKNAIVIGAGTKEDAYSVKKISVNDLSIGFLALTHKEFGTLDDDSIEDSVGTAWINSSEADRAILQSKQECDYLIVLPHAGVENVDVPLPEWRSRYKEFIELGADAVIASHPHVPQGWEVYKNSPIFYCLGNFIFDSFSKTHGPYWNKGLAVQLSLSDKRVTFEVFNISYMNGHLSLDNSNESKAHNTFLCSLLDSEEAYRLTVNRAVSELWRDEYQLYLLRGLGGLSLRASKNTIIHSAYGILKGADMAMLLNNFQCESHRWAIERYLRNKLNEK